MDIAATESKLIGELKKIVELINELIKSGIKLLVDAKDFVWSIWQTIIEKLFSFFESVFTKKEIIDLLEFKEGDLFI
jgi:hypothetical protein